jgi:hypothetical protein
MNPGGMLHQSLLISSHLLGGAVPGEAAEDGTGLLGVHLLLVLVQRVDARHDALAFLDEPLELVAVDALRPRRAAASGMNKVAMARAINGIESLRTSSSSGPHLPSWAAAQPARPSC